MQELYEIEFPAALSSCFKKLPEIIESTQVGSHEALLAAFHHVFQCEQAKSQHGVVFIWAVDKPYVHDSGNRLASKISYIEKTDQTISARWPRNSIINLTTDQEEGDIKGEPNFLRSYADVNKNLTFYNRLIREYGPLHIWWAGSASLNEASGTSLSPRDWERHLLTLYRNRHNCLPLKNRKR